MTQLSIHVWMYKRTVGHSYDGMLPGKKKGWSLDTHKNMDESQKTWYWVKEDRLKNQSTYYMIPSIENSRKCKLIYRDSGSLEKMRGRMRGRNFLQKVWKLFRGIDVLIILIVGMVLWVYVYLETYQSIHFKHVQFIECQLYFNKSSKKKKTYEE